MLLSKLLDLILEAPQQLQLTWVSLHVVSHVTCLTIVEKH